MIEEALDFQEKQRFCIDNSRVFENGLEIAHLWFTNSSLNALK
jgi:hypothetical protein